MRIRMNSPLLKALHAIAFVIASRNTLRADLPALDPLAKPSTRLGPAYVVALDVSVNGIDEPELCGLFTLDGEGRIDITVGFQPQEKIPLRGMTSDDAQKSIAAVIQRFYASRPEVRVGIAKIPRFDVVVEGATFTSGIVRLPVGARLSDLLAEAGYLPSADLSQVTVTRFDAKTGRTILRADFQSVLSGASLDARNDPELRNGDLITLRTSTKPMPPSTIVVLGEVKLQGKMPYKRDMRVRDALVAARLKPTADLDQMLIRRMDGNHMSVNPAGALRNEPTENLAMQPDDTIVVLRKDSGLRYSIVGAVPAPQTFDFKKPVGLKQAILDVGGLRPDADRKAVLLIRNALSDPANAQTLTIDIDKIVSGTAPDIPLQSGDLVQVPVRKRQLSPLINIGLMLLRFLIL